MTARFLGTRTGGQALGQCRGAGICYSRRSALRCLTFSKAVGRFHWGGGSLTTGRCSVFPVRQITRLSSLPVRLYGLGIFARPTAGEPPPKKIALDHLPPGYPLVSDLTRSVISHRFRTTVEAFAFLASIAGEDSSSSAELSWMQPLSMEVIDKGFNLLRIRVDVSQLMLQIADKVPCHQCPCAVRGPCQNTVRNVRAKHQLQSDDARSNATGSPLVDWCVRRVVHDQTSEEQQPVKGRHIREL